MAKATQAIRENDRFVQLVVADGAVHALDAAGHVWRYYPSNEQTGQWAGWYELTTRRKGRHAVWEDTPSPPDAVRKRERE